MHGGIENPSVDGSGRLELAGKLFHLITALVKVRAR
jgi:hypothetical protein